MSDIENNVDQIIAEVKIFDIELDEKPKKKKKKSGYFDNAEMLELFRQKYELEALERTPDVERKLERIKNKIGVLYIKVADGMMKRPNFANYPPSQKEDMLSDALFVMSRAGDRYDVNFANPFAYFSQITFNAFRYSLKNMKKRTGLFVIVNHLENFDGFDDAGE
jgi:hypothetical protein